MTHKQRAPYIWWPQGLSWRCPRRSMAPVAERVSGGWALSYNFCSPGLVGGLGRFSFSLFIGSAHVPFLRLQNMPRATSDRFSCRHAPSMKSRKKQTNRSSERSVRRSRASMPMVVGEQGLPSQNLITKKFGQVNQLVRLSAEGCHKTVSPSPDFDYEYNRMSICTQMARHCDRSADLTPTKLGIH